MTWTGLFSLLLFLHHPQYVDAVATRYRDADAYVYLQDANYNVTAVVDNSGTVVERYSYTAYGESTVLEPDFSNDPNGTDIDNEYLYTGRRLDPETGLQINRNRIYDPPLGRWLTRDPIGYVGSAYNLYEYVSGMPTVAIDPFGLKCLNCTCEAENGRRTWNVEIECDTAGGEGPLFSDCCKDACWDSSVGFGHPINIEICGADPTEPCTPEEAWKYLCNKADCLVNCNRKWGWTCTIACSLPSAGTSTVPCLAVCWAGYEVCKNDCSECRN